MVLLTLAQKPQAICTSFADFCARQEAPPDVDDVEAAAEGGSSSSGAPAAPASSSSSSSAAAAAVAAEEEEEIDEAAEAEWEPLWVEVRRLFTHPMAAPAADLDLKWSEPDEAGLVKFLVERMQFNEERVLGGIKRLKAAKTSSSQQRMDSFFKVSGTSSSTNKRKVEVAKPKGNKKGKILAKGKK